jgi:hypothetical protein
VRRGREILETLEARTVSGGRYEERKEYKLFWINRIVSYFLHLLFYEISDTSCWFGSIL